MDLKELALEAGSDVSRNTDGSYETKRAVRAGRKVYAEYIAAKVTGNTNEVASPYDTREDYFRNIAKQCYFAVSETSAMTTQWGMIWWRFWL